MTSIRPRLKKGPGSAFRERSSRTAPGRASWIADPSQSAGGFGWPGRLRAIIDVLAVCFGCVCGGAETCYLQHHRGGPDST